MGIRIAINVVVRDAIDCGGGFDRVLADKKDVLAGNCEKKFTSPTRFLTSISPNYFDPLP